MRYQAITNVADGETFIPAGDEFDLDAAAAAPLLASGAIAPVAGAAAAEAPAGPRLTDVSGIGARQAARLGKCGIEDPAALAALDDDALAALDVTAAMRAKLPEWRDEARELVAS